MNLAYDEILGSLTAPTGSEPWAVAVRHRIQQSLRAHEPLVDNLETWIPVMQAEQGWKVLKNSKGKFFNTWREFCEDKFPFGLGYSPDALDALIAERKSAQQAAEEAKPLAAHGQRGKGQKRGSVRTSFKRGSNNEYYAARIARDHPEILDRMKSGEFKSVREAALAAGLIKPEFRCAREPEKVADGIRAKFSADEVKEIIRLLSQEKLPL